MRRLFAANFLSVAYGHRGVPKPHQLFAPASPRGHRQFDDRVRRLRLCYFPAASRNRAVTDEQQVQKLLDEISDSGSTPAEVCGVGRGLAAVRGGAPDRGASDQPAGARVAVVTSESGGGGARDDCRRPGRPVRRRSTLGATAAT
jgi:hypothetical protein